MRFVTRSTRLAAVLLLMVVPRLASADFTIDWWTVDAGGGQGSTGGGYTLSGTIGQPDASGVMTGGAYTLQGGFWAMSAPALPPGDIDGNGIVDIIDFQLFGDCMSGPDITTPPAGCDPVRFERADLDKDNDVDLHDMTLFQVFY